MASAVKQYLLGVSLADSPRPRFASLVDAALTKLPGCSSWSQAEPFFHCTGRIGWLNNDDGDGEAPPTQHVLFAQPLLDAMLDTSTAPTRQWARVPEDKGVAVRQVATRNYISNSTTACRGSSPYVFTMHYYCALDQTGEPSLRHLSRPVLSTGVSHTERYNAAPRATPAWMRPRSVDVGVQPFAACQRVAFYDLPSLCHPPFDALAPRRLGELIRRLYIEPRRNGFLRGAIGSNAEAEGDVHAATDIRSTTFGELSPETMAILVDAMAAAARPTARVTRREGTERRLQETAADTAGVSSHDWDDEPIPQFDASDCFVDVGSGVGKLVLATALLSSARAVGIEVVPDRHQRATAALADATRLGVLTAEEASRVQLIHGDALERNTLPPDTTFLYLSNLCFSSALNQQLLHAVTALPKLRCLASLRELALVDADHDDGAQLARALVRPSVQARSATCGRLELARTLQVSMTWDDQTSLFIYCCRRAAVRMSS